MNLVGFWLNRGTNCGKGTTMTFSINMVGTGDFDKSLTSVKIGGQASSGRTKLLFFWCDLSWLAEFIIFIVFLPSIGLSFPSSFYVKPGFKPTSEDHDSDRYQITIGIPYNNFFKLSSIRKKKNLPGLWKPRVNRCDRIRLLLSCCNLFTHAFATLDVELNFIIKPRWDLLKMQTKGGPSPRH